MKDSDMEQTRKMMAEELLQGKIRDDWGNYHRSRAPVEGKEQIKKGQNKKKMKEKEEMQKKQNLKQTPEEPQSADRHKELEGRDRKAKINWPKANSAEWEKLDIVLTEVLKTQQSAPENKAVVQPAIIYSICRERFGEKENKKKGKSGGPSKRQKKCKKLREQINILKETFRNAQESEKEGVRQLQEDKLRELRLVKRA